MVLRTLIPMVLNLCTNPLRDYGILVMSHFPGNSPDVAQSQA